MYEQSKFTVSSKRENELNWNFKLMERNLEVI